MGGNTNMMLLMILLCEVTTTGDSLQPEQAILELYGNAAFRPDSTTLCIITALGDTLFFTDGRVPENVEGYFDSLSMSDSYSLVSHLPEQNCWVIEHSGYEWIEWLLVNGENGRICTAISTPEPSPDGTRLLCAMEDIMAGFIDNGIQVWRIDEDSLALEFQDTAVPWGPTNAAWENDSTVVFEKLEYGLDTGSFTTRPGRLVLSDDGTWMPDDPADWE
jgi:hypothetical protein